MRAARLAMAEDFTRQAEELKQGMPEISLVLAAKALSITQQDGMPPIPTALQQVRDLLAPTDGIELRGHDGPVAQLAASRDGSWLASGDHQGLIRLWSTATREAIETPRILDGHWGRITQLVFTADNRWLASGSTDSTVHLWQLDASETNKAPLLLKNRQGRFASLAVSEDGRWLAIAGAGHVTNDVFVRLWDLRAEDILSSSIDLPTYQGQLCSLAVGRNGEWIATGNEDGSVRLWRISNLTHTVTATDLRMHNEPVRAIRFAPDGKSLIAAAGRGSGKGTVRAWGLNSSDASIDAVLADSERGVELFTLSPDGRWLFTADQSPSLRVRDLTKLDGEEAGAAVEGQTLRGAGDGGECEQSLAGDRGHGQRRAAVVHRPDRPDGDADHDPRPARRGDGDRVRGQRRLAGDRQRPRQCATVEPAGRRSDSDGEFADAEVGEGSRVQS